MTTEPGPQPVSHGADWARLVDSGWRAGLAGLPADVAVAASKLVSLAGDVLTLADQGFFRWTTERDRKLAALFAAGGQLDTEEAAFTRLQRVGSAARDVAQELVESAQVLSDADVDTDVAEGRRQAGAAGALIQQLLSAELELARSLSAVAVRQAVEDAEEVAQTKDTVAAHSGEMGDSVLAKHFADYASKESRAGLTFMSAFLGVLLLSSAVAAFLVRSAYENEVPLERSLIKLSITLPLFAIAAYLARQAERHRAAAGQARGIAVRLMTLPLYLRDVDVADRRTLRAAWGAEVFTLVPNDGKLAAGAPAPTAESLGSIAEALQRLLPSGGK